VEGNWFGPVYPAFAIAAAVAAEKINWQWMMRSIAEISSRSALAVGVVLFVLIGLQSAFGLIPLRKDPTARLLAVGWQSLAADIEAMRVRLGARCVVASNYGLVSWLTFYLPPGTCVAQINERMRWISMPEPSTALFNGKVLFIGDANLNESDMLRAKYDTLEPQGLLSRERRGQVIETYRLDLVDGLKGDPFDRSPPPELQSP
jgi:hypothetical protein